MSVNGTLENLSKSAFVRTPPRFAQAIADTLLSYPDAGKPFTVFDPTCGEGDLLAPYQRIAGARLYGVEVSRDRAFVARSKVPGAHILTSAIEGVSVPSASMSLVVCNPPYCFENGQRAEYRITADVGDTLVPGGVLVNILPARSAWDGLMVNHYLKWYSDVAVYKFPDAVAGDSQEGCFEDFTQICVVALRRATPNLTPSDTEKTRLLGYRYLKAEKGPKGKPAHWAAGAPPPDIPTEPLHQEARYTVPACALYPQLILRHADDAARLYALAHVYMGEGIKAPADWRLATEWQPERVLTGKPVMPLTGPAHVAAEVLTGVIDGGIVRGPDREGAEDVPHLFASFVGQQWQKQEVDADELEKLRQQGALSVSVQQRNDKPILGVLNLKTGVTTYHQGDPVFTFLGPWLATMAKDVMAKRTPLYNLNPQDWMLRVLAHFAQDKRLPNAEFAGLAPAQLHRVFAMYTALCTYGKTVNSEPHGTGAVAMQGEPGTGKTRLAGGVAALMGYRWRHRFDEFAHIAQPRWMKELRRAWLKNKRTLAILGLEPMRDATTGQVLGYRSLTTGEILTPEQAGPRALPILIATPKKVTTEYGKEIEAAFPDAEVIQIEKHTDVTRWMQRCAESDAPIVLGIFSHSTSRAFSVIWHPAVHEQKKEVVVPDLTPNWEALHLDKSQYKAIRNQRTGALFYYEHIQTGETLLKREVQHTFRCPDCGQVIKAVPDGKLKKIEEKAKKLGGSVKSDESGGKEIADAIADIQKEDERKAEEAVSSRIYFETRQRWCSCPTHVRNRPSPRNPLGQTQFKAPLWMTEWRDDLQAKYPRPTFQQWGTLSDHLYSQIWEPFLDEEKRPQERLRLRGTLPQTLRPKDSFSPYDYLQRFFEGCVVLSVVDESHNGRGRNTDIGRAHHTAMRAAQTRMLTSGTHYGGQISDFYHYWFRFNPRFWIRLGFGWNDAEKALQRYGVIQQWVTEHESEARKGTGETDKKTTTVAAPGLSAKLIPYLLEDMAYLTVLDVGSFMPERNEKPILVDMVDPAIEEPLKEFQMRIRAIQQAQHALAKEQQDLFTQAASDNKHLSLERNRIASEDLAGQLTTLMKEFDDWKKWAASRNLNEHYTNLVKSLRSQAENGNAAARLAQGTLPRLFATLPCDKPFEVWETHRGQWGDKGARHRIIETPLLTREYVYPMEKRLIDLVRQELAEGRRVMIYTEQNKERSMSKRLCEVLKDFPVWSLPHNVEPEDRQEAILSAVKSGKQVIIVQSRRVNEGLNLQSGIDTIIWYEMAMNLFNLDQASRRAWRLGKREEVRIYYLVYLGTKGHAKLHKLGQQSGAAAAFAGEVAQGALIEHAGADKTTLAKLSKSFADSSSAGGVEGEEEEFVFTGDLHSEEAQLQQAFAERDAQLRAALRRGRKWIGVVDTLPDRLRAIMAEEQGKPSSTIWGTVARPPVKAATAKKKETPLVVKEEPRVIITKQMLPPPPLMKSDHPLLITPPVGVPAQPPTPSIASKAVVVFGSSESLALIQKSRTGGASTTRRKKKGPVTVVRTIPALFDKNDLPLTSKKLGPILPVATYSLWNLEIPEDTQATTVDVVVDREVVAPVVAPVEAEEGEIDPFEGWGEPEIVDGSEAGAGVGAEEELGTPVPAPTSPPSLTFTVTNRDLREVLQRLRTRRKRGQIYRPFVVNFTIKPHGLFVGVEPLEEQDPRECIPYPVKAEVTGQKAGESVTYSLDGEHLLSDLTRFGERATTFTVRSQDTSLTLSAQDTRGFTWSLPLCPSIGRRVIPQTLTPKGEEDTNPPQQPFSLLVPEVVES